jgi:hypothetical protein
VESPIRAAGILPIKTDFEPFTIVSGGEAAQKQVLPTVAAGKFPISTEETPFVIGPPTCGMGGVPGVCIGQTCISEILAAGDFGMNGNLVNADAYMFTRNNFNSG